MVFVHHLTETFIHIRGGRSRVGWGEWSEPQHKTNRTGVSGANVGVRAH